MSEASSGTGSLKQMLLNFYATKLIAKQAIAADESYVEPLTKSLMALPPGSDTDHFIFESHGVWTPQQIRDFIALNKQYLCNAVYRYITQRRCLTDWVEYAYESILNGLLSIRLTTLYPNCTCGVHLPDRPYGCKYFTQPTESITYYYHIRAARYNTNFTDEQYVADLMRFLQCANVEELNATIEVWISSDLQNLRYLYTLYTSGYIDLRSCVLPTLVYSQPVLRLRRYIDHIPSKFYLITSAHHMPQPPANNLCQCYSPTVYPALELVISHYLHHLLVDEKAIIAHNRLRIKVCDGNKGRPYYYYFPLNDMTALADFMMGCFTRDPLTLILQYLIHCE